MNIMDIDNIYGWPIELYAFEGGLTLTPNKNGWITHAGSYTGPVLINPDDVMKKFHPILMRVRPKGSHSYIPLILDSQCRLAPEVPNNVFFQPKLLQYFRQGKSLHYIAGALRFHLDELISQLVIIRDGFNDVSPVPGLDAGSDGILFADQPYPYYEFDALLVAARRAYDTCRHVLWQEFGEKRNNSTSTPRSFVKTIPLCHDLDPSVRHDLQTSWDNWGKTLTHYRDCLMHYAPIGLDFGAIILQQEFPKVWTAQARIPDNPEVRSQGKFTFKKNFNAPTYGWKISNEILRMLKLVINVVKKNCVD